MFQIDNTLNFRFDNFNYQKDFTDGRISHAYTLLRISPAVKYYLNNNAWRLYAKVGAMFYSVSKETSNLTYTATVTKDPLGLQKTTETKSQDDALAVYKKPFGLAAALGVDMPGLKRLGGFVELRAESIRIDFITQPVSIGSTYWNNGFSAFSFSLGARF